MKCLQFAEKVTKNYIDMKSLLIIILFNFRVISASLHSFYDNNNIDVKSLKYAFLRFCSSVHGGKFSNKLFNHNTLFVTDVLY